MALQHDLRSSDRLMFLGSTGWIVWILRVDASTPRSDPMDLN
jgi:acetoacetyl-CoA synthetase